MSDVVTSPITRCPPELIARTWEFLDENSLAGCESVCKGWRAQIATPDQHVWQTFCRITNRSDFPRYEELSRELEVFDKRAVELIFGYVDENYKELASVIHGKIVLDCRSVYLSMPDKEGCFAQLPWGRSEREPYIWVAVYNDESLAITERALERGDVKTAMRLRGEWGCGYPGIPTRRFPMAIPLRLFYNRNGGLKNHGDKLLLNYKGKHIDLVCTFNDYMQTCDNTEFHTYAEAIEHRIDISVRNFRYITRESINSAREAAMTEPRERIPSEAR